MTWAAKAFRPLNQIMDLVFVEQRGTAGSGLQTCPGLQPTSTTLDLAAISAAARRCLASASRDPRHDTTTSAVRDLDQVRQALGYDTINIYGPSYGVTMGLAYLQRYGSHVRTAVLDSGSLLSVPSQQTPPAVFPMVAILARLRRRWPPSWQHGRHSPAHTDSLWRLPPSRSPVPT